MIPCRSWLTRNGYGALGTRIWKKPELFAHLQQERIYLTDTEIVALAEKLAANNGGLIPNAWWLQRNGYSPVDNKIRKAPHLFSHLKQYRVPRIAEVDSVTVAEQLAERNNGKVPSHSWLKANGYYGLAQRIYYKQPELFAHLKKDDGPNVKRQLKAVELAEALAKNNEGMIPTAFWLRQNGHEKLYLYIRANPRLFAHLKMDKTPWSRQNEKQAVLIAEKLAKEHGGRLPSHKWLKAHGFKRLAKRITAQPGLFKHLIQERLIKTDAEVVAIAEKLAKSHRGTLPSKKWLIDHKYHCILNRKYRKPHLFSHLKQDWQGGLSDEEAIAIAEKLAKTHRGTIPNAKWLQTHGFMFLYMRMWKKPRLFKHIPQIRRRSQSA